jgi:hypothetical protein
MKFKPFGIYRCHQYRNPEDGIWERIKWFNKPEDALQCIKDLTKRPKSERVWTYTVLPVNSFERYIQIDEEHREQLLKAAR